MNVLTSGRFAEGAAAAAAGGDSAAAAVAAGSNGLRRNRGW